MGIVLKNGPRSDPDVSVLWANDGGETVENTSLSPKKLLEQSVGTLSGLDNLKNTILEAHAQIKAKHRNEDVYFKDTLQITATDPTFPPLTLLTCLV